MRLIDADVITDWMIKELRNHSCGAFKGLSGRQAANMIGKRIDETPTVGEWVSVKDRLPEENCEYIVFVTDIEGEKCVTVDQWLSHARHWFLFDDKAESEVTHWMPMPPPPKEMKLE